MPKRPKYDWEAIEREYRIGQKSMRTIADEYGPNASNISRRAKKHGWVQDKSEEVRDKTSATLIAQQERNTPTREDIEKAVQTNVQVIRGHRQSIGNGLKLVAMFNEQLKDVADNRESYEDEVESETADGGKDGKPNYQRRNRLMKAISLPAHASILKDLSFTLKSLIPLERQAFNLDATSTGKTIEDQLKELDERTR